MIIAIEHDYPFELTVDNVDGLAGKNNPYHKFVQGFGILLSRAMKTKSRDNSDWGEGKMMGELQHLFRQRYLFVR